MSYRLRLLLPLLLLRLRLRLRRRLLALQAAAQPAAGVPWSRTFGSPGFGCHSLLRLPRVLRAGPGEGSLAPSWLLLAHQKVMAAEACQCQRRCRGTVLLLVLLLLGLLLLAVGH